MGIREKLEGKREIRQSQEERRESELREQELRPTRERIGSLQRLRDRLTELRQIFSEEQDELQSSSAELAAQRRQIEEIMEEYPDEVENLGITTASAMATHEDFVDDPESTAYVEKREKAARARKRRTDTIREIRDAMGREDTSISEGIAETRKNRHTSGQDTARFREKLASSVLANVDARIAALESEIEDLSLNTPEGREQYRKRVEDRNREHVVRNVQNRILHGDPSGEKGLQRIHIPIDPNDVKAAVRDPRRESLIKEAYKNLAHEGVDAVAQGTTEALQEQRTERSGVVDEWKEVLNASVESLWNEMLRDALTEEDPSLPKKLKEAEQLEKNKEHEYGVRTALEKLRRTLSHNQLEIPCTVSIWEYKNETSILLGKRIEQERQQLQEEIEELERNLAAVTRQQKANREKNRTFFNRKKLEKERADLARKYHAIAAELDEKKRRKREIDGFEKHVKTSLSELFPSPQFAEGLPVHAPFGEILDALEKKCQEIKEGEIPDPDGTIRRFRSAEKITEGANRSIQEINKKHGHRLNTFFVKERGV